MKKSLSILLIEDDMDDVELLQEALNNMQAQYLMHVINDGDKVLDYLHAATSHPDVIIMDLNLPKVHGKEILKQIKAYTIYNEIPIAVLTTSSSPEDKKYVLDLGANVFLIKPTSTKGLAVVAETVMELAAHSKRG